MSYENIDATLPYMCKTVKEILNLHKNDKGLIHCNSYKIANYIKANIKNSRLLIHDSDTREAVLNEHITSDKPTVLISPSMTEGIDLHDDLSRFQIICKVPYPSLASKLIRKRMHKWKWWYDCATLKTMMQSIGRSIRSKDDWCVTYIIDSNFEYFYNKNRDMFPAWFKEALVL